MLSQVFFTDDDGKTWFPDDAKRVPPFDRNGKPAVRAHVYKCGGKTFVNHMERYTPEAKKKVEAIYAKEVQQRSDRLDGRFSSRAWKSKQPGTARG